MQIAVWTFGYEITAPYAKKKPTSFGASEHRLQPQNDTGGKVHQHAE